MNDATQAQVNMIAFAEGLQHDSDCSYPLGDCFCSVHDAFVDGERTFGREVYRRAQKASGLGRAHFRAAVDEAVVLRVNGVEVGDEVDRIFAYRKAANNVAQSAAGWRSIPSWVVDFWGPDVAWIGGRPGLYVDEHGVVE